MTKKRAKDAATAAFGSLLHRGKTQDDMAALVKENETLQRKVKQLIEEHATQVTASIKCFPSHADQV